MGEAAAAEAEIDTSEREELVMVAVNVGTIATVVPEAGAAAGGGVTVPLTRGHGRP